MTLAEIINERIQNGLLTHLHTDTYECGCGSILARSSLRNHFTTMVHAEWEMGLNNVAVNPDMGDLSKTEEVVVLDGENCDICYDTRIEFQRCKECRNSICKSCGERVQRCPFCRASFEVRVPDLPYIVRNQFEQQYISHIEWVNTAPTRRARNARRYLFCETIIERFRDVLHHPRYRNLKADVIAFIHIWMNDGFPVLDAIEYTRQLS